MILTGPPTTPIPHIVELDHAGRMFLLGWLQVEVICGRPITASSWRDAWGRAADVQTVANARTVLARMPEGRAA